MTIKVPNDHKIYYIAVICILTRGIKYTNIFHSKALQNLLKLGFLVCYSGNPGVVKQLDSLELYKMNWLNESLSMNVISVMGHCFYTKQKKTWHAQRKWRHHLLSWQNCEGVMFKKDMATLKTKVSVSCVYVSVDLFHTWRPTSVSRVSSAALSGRGERRRWCRIPEPLVILVMATRLRWHDGKLRYSIGDNGQRLLM
jgi:hypothetical protein